MDLVTARSNHEVCTECCGKEPVLLPKEMMPSDAVVHWIARVFPLIAGIVVRWKRYLSISCGQDFLVS